MFILTLKSYLRNKNYVNLYFAMLIPVIVMSFKFDFSIILYLLSFENLSSIIKKYKLPYLFIVREHFVYSRFVLIYDLLSLIFFSIFFSIGYMLYSFKFGAQIQNIISLLLMHLIVFSLTVLIGNIIILYFFKQKIRETIASKLTLLILVNVLLQMSYFLLKMLFNYESIIAYIAFVLLLLTIWIIQYKIYYKIIYLNDTNSKFI